MQSRPLLLSKFFLSALTPLSFLNEPPALARSVMLLRQVSVSQLTEVLTQFRFFDFAEKSEKFNEF